MDDYHNKAIEIYGSLIDEGWTDEDIAEISLNVYDVTGIDLSEPPEDPFEDMDRTEH